jgi:hypothetical protein
VAVKLTGDPLAPLRVAWAVWEPETVPRVHALLAIPFASVVEEAVREALGAVVDQATVSPDDGAPFSVTTTWSGFASGCATVPV